MVETKVLVKKEYVTLIPPIPLPHGGRLLMTIILNQDNVILDGHHRIRACEELELVPTYTVKDFTDRPPQAHAARSTSHNSYSFIGEGIGIHNISAWWY